MASELTRARRRRWLIAVYVGLYALTLIGVRQGDLRLWGIPLWYLWVGALLTLLVPLNLWFVQTAWPTKEPTYKASSSGRSASLPQASSPEEANRE